MLVVLHKYLTNTEYVQDLNKSENVLLLSIEPLVVLKIDTLTLLRLVIDFSKGTA